MAKNIIKKMGEIEEEKEIGNGFGIAGFVLGILPLFTLLIHIILSILGFYFTPLSILFVISLVLTIPGLIFSIIQIKRKSTGLAIAGLVLNIICIIITISMVISMFESPPHNGPGVLCLGPNMQIVKADASTDTVQIQRLASGKINNVVGVKILVDGKLTNIQAVNGVPCTKDDEGINNCEKKDNLNSYYGLQQLEIKNYTINSFEPGQTVTAALVVGDDKGNEYVCETGDSIKAV
jgi:hypothetical protein